MATGTYLFAFFLIAIWIVSGGFTTDANVYLTAHKGDDHDMKNAWNYTFAVAFITWGLIGIFIIGIIVLFCTGAGEAGVAVEETGVAAEGIEAEGVSATEKIESVGRSSKRKKGSVMADALLVIGFLLCILTGLLSAAAAKAIHKSPKFTSSNTGMERAYKDTIISACINLGVLGVIVIGFIVKKVLEQRRKNRIIMLRRLKAEEAAKETAETSV